MNQTTENARFTKEVFMKNNKETQSRFRKALKYDFEETLKKDPILAKDPNIERFKILVLFDRNKSVVEMRGKVNIWIIPRKPDYPTQVIHCDGFEFFVRQDKRTIRPSELFEKGF